MFSLEKRSTTFGALTAQDRNNRGHPGPLTACPPIDLYSPSSPYCCPSATATGCHILNFHLDDLSTLGFTSAVCCECLFYISARRVKSNKTYVSNRIFFITIHFSRLIYETQKFLIQLFFVKAIDLKKKKSLLIFLKPYSALIFDIASSIFLSLLSDDIFHSNFSNAVNRIFHFW